MNPSFDLRFQSMRRAMTTVIMPALDPANQLAQEQAALMIAHLDMMTTQWSRVDAFARLCLADLVAVVTKLDPMGGAATNAAIAAAA